MTTPQLERSDLIQAFDDFVDLHGRERAVAVLEEATGLRDPNNVPKDQFFVAMSFLLGRLTVGMRQARATVSTQRTNRLKQLHDALAGIAATAFGRREKTGAAG